MNEAIALSWAARIGEYAWPGFMLVLLVAVSTAGVVGWRASRAAPDTEPDADQAPQVGRRLIAGFLLIVLLATGFATIASQLGDGRQLQRCDEFLSHAIGQYTPSGVKAVFGHLTHLGDPLLLWGGGIVIAVILSIKRHRGLAAVWAVALLGNAILNRVLKEIFARTRPLIDGMPGPVDGFSFPSGHASASMVAYAMLVWLAWHLQRTRWRPPIAMAATAIVLTTASSRVFLQVHYASDVLAGLCSGAAWTTVCILSAAHLRRRRA
ncbi:phosphatase PAP2 family protein [Xylophilus sp. GOD-11R]|uniref:phosphatase PAP2 family protein n=1 Tax=Xylophilus sp. GOD-11R TaxID=3089814 RepID=UPI00298CB448|nr:phosphatase PAP2 family protein [Xylophilus sp. GOD-11R]WPB57962.1 phosphatase PAP2 family protein [Xylophilus sp. GOD-11R]